MGVFTSQANNFDKYIWTTFRRRVLVSGNPVLGSGVGVIDRPGPCALPSNVYKGLRPYVVSLYL